MRRAETPIARDLLLLGGGHSHALVLRMLGMKPLDGVRVTLVSDATHAPYSGMLPGLIAGFYTWDEAHIDLRRLCQFAGARFIRAQVTSLDLKTKRARLDGRPPIAFDVVSINIGSTPALAGVPGASQFAIPAKPVSQLLERWEEIVREIPGRPPRLVIVGGGAGGVELAVTMQARLGGKCEVTIVHQGPHILPGHNSRVRTIFSRLLAERGVRVRLDDEVTAVRDRAVVCASGEIVEGDHIFWVTNASAPAWLAASGLRVDGLGFVLVADTLQSTGHEFVFAAGDVATIASDPRPKSGVYAVREARPLAENLRRYLTGRPLRPYHPQRHFLSLVGTGNGSAVASRKHLAAEGRMWWKLKDWIDRRFMRKFSDLKPMSDASEPSDPSDGEASARREFESDLDDLRRRATMRCLGCAAKVGGTSLERAMARVRDEHGDFLREQAATPAVQAGLDRPDDAAVFTVPAGRSLVQTVDYLPALLGDPHLFARVATLHGFSDVFAMGAEPHSALLAALIPFGTEAATEETLFQLVSGVIFELRKMGATLLGGHTAEGSPLAVALTCNGLVEPSHLLRKGGLGPSQALVLTKPLGIGTLFAAEMRLKARGAWIDGAIASMLVSNRSAAAIVRAHGATACTDVTGFGLIGHLLEMVRASNARAQVDLDAVPLLAGAAECAANGILSSLHPQNSLAVAAIANAADFKAHRAFPLLFDPQTSGGLLAALPEKNAAACVAALREAGCPSAAVIGQVVAQDDSGALVVLGGGRAVSPRG